MGRLHFEEKVGSIETAVDTSHELREDDFHKDMERLAYIWESR